MAILQLLQRLFSWVLNTFLQSLKKLKLLLERRKKLLTVQVDMADHSALIVQGDAIFFVQKVSFSARGQGSVGECLELKKKMSRGIL